MSNSDLRDHAYQFFIEEAPELLQIIEHGLLTLKTERTSAKIHELMRAAHSIKGGAASVELPAIKTLSHRLEDIFKALYNEAVVIDDDMESLLLQAYDCLKTPLLLQIEQGDFDQELALSQGLPVLEAIEFLLGDHLAAGEQFLPSSSDLGVDIVSSLFEVDISQGINELQTALESGNPELTREVLSLHTEVFAGLAELLNLTGFKEITGLVQTALAENPEDIFPLAQAALENWRESCEQVLHYGDRQVGGTPSSTLRDLAQSSLDNTLLADPFAALDPLPDLGEMFVLAEDPATLEETSAPVKEPEQEDPVNTAEPAYQFFIEEAPELLQIIEQSLLTLRDDRSAARIHEIMRAAHSLKGGAASVGLKAIKSIAHRLEDIFKALYSNDLVFDETLDALLLAGFDCLKNPLETHIRSGSYDPNSTLIEAQTVLGAIEFHLGDYLVAGEQFMPSSADLGVDIVSNLFEIDISQGLTEITVVLESGDSGLVHGVLRAQNEVFLGLAELLNLPGFKAIAEAVAKGLENSPDQVMAIARQALQDWQDSCDQVLHHGDRQQGGNPSALLLRFGEKTETDEKTTLQAEPQPRLSISDLFFGDDEDENTEAETSLPVEVESIELPPAQEITAEEQLALDDVFGIVLPELEVAETPEVSFELAADIEEQISGEEIQTAIPSLEEMFGGLIPDGQLTEGGVFADFDLDQASLAADDQNVFDLVQSVEQSFETFASLDVALPTLIADEAPHATVTPDVTIAKVPEIAKTPAATNLSIRVDFQRLERMNNWVGELAINGNSLSLQNQQLQSAVKSLLTRFSRFQGLTGKLRELADQLVIMPGGGGSLRSRQEKAAWVNSTFDSLEMDSYGELSEQLQEILEEMLQLEESVDDIVLFARASNQSLESQRQTLFSLRDELMWARMLPLGEVLNRFPRVLRDLSTKYHKPVELKIYGASVLVDRLALEKLNDPLLHLLRNAFDHGIEAPEIRQQQGKPTTGSIEIHAFHQGNQTIIEIRDDGGGLNTEKIAQRGIEKGLITAEQAAKMPPEQLYNLIFEPDFSTASQVSELSGRGVGLDVVRQQLLSLKGNIVVSSRLGRGSTFSLRLPLTLTIAKLLVCLVSQEDQLTSTAVAIPSDSVAELMVPLPSQVKSSGGQRFLLWQQQMIPIYALNRLIPYNCPLGDLPVSNVLSTVSPPDDWSLPLILVRQGNHYCALEVTRLVTEQELVIKPFAPIMPAPSYLYGCTILGDGTLVPVVNAGMLLEWYEEKGENVLSTTLGAQFGQEDLELSLNDFSSNQPQTILIVDDSAALRRTLAFTLEKSGYRVLQAKDGQEALETLNQTQGIQLVICDVEMPNLNGFEFLGQRRRNPDMAKIPVAMLTSRGSDKHRQLATHLGANAYFTKPFIEQQFLTAIKDLLSVQLIPV